MRKLTEKDIDAIIGTQNAGYTIERARVKDGEFTDHDHYGIVLASNSNGHFATWQFHLINESPEYYWGHYHQGNNAGAVEDFKMRD